MSRKRETSTNPVVAYALASSQLHLLRSTQLTRRARLFLSRRPKARVPAELLPAISTSFVEHCLRLVSALAAGALLFTRPRFVLSTPFCLLSGARKRQVAVGPQAKPARHAFCHRLHRGLSFAVSLFFSFLLSGCLAGLLGGRRMVVSRRWAALVVLSGADLSPPPAPVA